MIQSVGGVMKVGRDASSVTITRANIHFYAIQEEGCALVTIKSAVVSCGIPNHKVICQISDFANHKIPRNFWQEIREQQPIVTQRALENIVTFGCSDKYITVVANREQPFGVIAIQLDSGKVRLIKGIGSDRIQCSIINK